MTYKFSGVLSIDENTTIDETCIFKGVCYIGKNVKIGPYCVFENVRIDDNVEILPFSYIADTEIGANSVIGPYARTRNNVNIGENVVIGNFVEIKNSDIANGTHAKHLTYLGDAKIGENVNIGCGTVTCNYNGRDKNKTVIDDGAFIGSGTLLIAPVKVGKDALTAAGTVITKDVPDDKVGIGRSQQININKTKRIERPTFFKFKHIALNNPNLDNLRAHELVEKLNSLFIREPLINAFTSPPNEDSFKTLLKFISKFPDFRTPGLGYLNDGVFYAQWGYDNKYLLTIDFFNDENLFLRYDDQTNNINNIAISITFDLCVELLSNGMGGRIIHSWVKRNIEQKPVQGNIPYCTCHACIKKYDIRDDHGGLISMSRMIVCPICGNKRCPHASDHELGCTDSNEPGQVGSIY